MLSRHDRTTGMAGTVPGGQHIEVPVADHLAAVVAHVAGPAGQDDPRAAAASLAEALGLTGERIGTDHPEVLAATRVLAALHRRMGELPEARSLLENAIAAGQFTRGEQDPVMLGLAFDLAYVAHELENRHEARRNFERVRRHGPAVLEAQPAVGPRAATGLRAAVGPRAAVGLRAAAGPRAAVGPRAAAGPRVGQEARMVPRSPAALDTSVAPHETPAGRPDSAAPPGRTRGRVPAPPAHAGARARSCAVPRACSPTRVPHVPGRRPDRASPDPARPG